MVGRLTGGVEASIHLDALATELMTVSDFRAEIVLAIGSEAAFLQVAGLRAADVTEEIYCHAGTGAWWFTWRWGDRIGLATDVKGAANAILHVLRVRQELSIAAARTSDQSVV
ncbi:MAG: hypothetical protein JWN52_2570 [Actinomycetia bacterium]|nr:hypothetical protein [Actinomycetes bacterium]